MTYLQLAYLHLATIVPAFLIGTALLFMRKGTPRHKLLGRIYMPLMLLTALTTLFMPAAYVHARRGAIAQHRGAMIGLYVGGILIAGSFALMPGRLLHAWIFRA